MENSSILNTEINASEFFETKTYLKKVLGMAKEKAKEPESKKIINRACDSSIVLHPEISLLINWDLDKPPTLEEAQEIVGGYVEIALEDNKNEKQCLVNEEGLLLKLAFNELASKLCKKQLVGTALVLEGKSRWMD